MYLQSKKLLLLLSLGACTSLRAMLFDNRHFFILRQPITRFECQSLYLSPKAFIMTADEAFDEMKRRIKLPTLYGTYNQAVIADALVEAGITPTNVLPPDLRGRSSIVWDIDAKLEAQGIALNSSYRFLDYFEVGGGFYALHARQGYEFTLNNPNEFTEGEQKELFLANEKIKEALNLVPAQWNETSFGDFFLYGRIGSIWEYFAKFHRIDAGASVGVFIPTAQARDIFNPASLALGGNGHVGIFAGVDAQFELKEDLVAGFEFMALKRLERVRLERFPLCARISTPPPQPTSQSPSQPNNQSTDQPTRQTPVGRNQPAQQAGQSTEAQSNSSSAQADNKKKDEPGYRKFNESDHGRDTMMREFVKVKPKETTNSQPSQNKPKEEEKKKQQPQQEEIPQGEPLNYGALVIPALVDPGLTIHFAPYLAFERLRDGFGVRFIYHFIRHFQDEFVTQVPANLIFAQAISEWRADIVSFNILYDFGYHKEERQGSPVLSLSFDVTFENLFSRLSSKTNVISLTFEVGF